MNTQDTRGTYVRPPARPLGDPADLRLADGAPYPVTAVLFLHDDLALGTRHGLPFLHHVLRTDTVGDRW